MEAKRYDKERLEAVAFCRTFHKLCIEKKLYLKTNTSRIEFAHLMNTNHVYFCRKIKQGSGFSPNRFIRAIRMNIAYKLLKSTNYSITRILDECGYTDKSSFYRAFTEQYHCSPNAMRKRYFAN